MAIGIIGGLIGGWLWVNVLNRIQRRGWLGAIVIATLGLGARHLLLRSMSRRD